MKNRALTSIALVFALGLAASSTGCIIVADDGDSLLTVENRSDFTIWELYVTDVDSPTWGPNLLRGDVLYPDESIHIEVACGTYDAYLVDETDAVCEINYIDLCYNDAVWIINNRSCPVFE